MTFFLATGAEIKNKNEFYWLYEQLLSSIGHDYTKDENHSFDAIIYYGNSPEENMSKSVLDIHCPSLYIPFESLSIHKAILNKTEYGEVIANASFTGDQPFIRDKLKTYISFDLTQFLFSYLSEREYLDNSNRDRFGRLTYELSSKKDIEVENPILNMWAHWIDNWLSSNLKIGDKLYYRKNIWPNQAEMAISFSHDVDIVNKSYYRYWRTYLYSLKKGETSLLGFFQSFAKDLYSKLLKGVTPFVNFQFSRILEFHEKHKIKATFNIIASNEGGLDNEDYLTLAQDDIRRLMDEKHEIGLHGGFQSRSYRDETVYLAEKLRLESIFNIKVVSNRQHYLGYEHDKTFSILEKGEIKYDSTIAYPDRAGFKVCFASPYQPWISSQKRNAKLYELPLIIMDGTLFSKAYSNFNLKDAKAKFDYLFTTVLKYHGVLTINWHQRIFSGGPYDSWMKLYHYAVDLTNKHNIYKDTQKAILERYQIIKNVKISVSNASISISSPKELNSFSFRISKNVIARLPSKHGSIFKDEYGNDVIEIEKIMANEVVEIPIVYLN